MKFRKRPVVIDAEQFFPDRKPWPEGVETRTPLLSGLAWGIETLEGWHVVSPSDWIVTGIKGERHPCRADIFELTYERVEEE